MWITLNEVEAVIRTTDPVEVIGRIEIDAEKLTCHRVGKERVSARAQHLVWGRFPLPRNPKVRQAINGLRELQLSREELIRIAKRIGEANPRLMLWAEGV